MLDAKSCSIYPGLPSLNLSFGNTRYSCTPMQTSNASLPEITIVARVGLCGDEVVHHYGVDLMRQLRNNRDKPELSAQVIHQVNLRYLKRIVGRMLHDASTGKSLLWPKMVRVQLSPDLEPVVRTFEVEEWQLIQAGLVSSDVLVFEVEGVSQIRGNESSAD